MTARGTLRIYLGAAPGVGKTYAMLDEGWRRSQRDTDVVVGFVETHRRPRTAAQVRDLEVVPRRAMEYRGATFDEMDVDAVLARQPQVALVDELAHTNVPGSRNEKRWQDVEELLAAGIDVISTVNVQHLESLNDVIEKITGVVQRETVPDEVVRRADQVELVDMSPEALRRRMAHGNIYPPERVDAALANYFRPGNLAALRELALLWVADRVEEGLQGYMDAHGIVASWETRERVVLAITGAVGGEQIIRRAARIASRQKSELIGVRVVASDGLASRPGPELEAQRALLSQLGGKYYEVVGEDVAVALAEFARSEKATQLVLGATRRSRTHELLHGSIVNRVLRSAEGLEVHVISTEPEEGAEERELRMPTAGWSRRAAPLPRRRQLIGLGLAALGLPLLTIVLAADRDHVSLPTDLLLLLAYVVVVAAVGGAIVGVVAAVIASVLANWFFVPPIHTLTIGDPENLVALVVFIAVAVTLGFFVDATAARSHDAGRARAEAEILARTTAMLLAGPDPVLQLVDHIRTTFALQAVSLLNRADDTWRVVASAGDAAPVTPFDGTTWDVAVAPETMLVIRGPQIRAEDQRVLRTFASQLAIALESRRLQAEVQAAAAVADANSLRTALLQAVSHDLRTPLASIKASVTSLEQRDVQWSDRERDEFLATIHTEADRLNRVVGDLLDMSRLQAGAVRVVTRPVYLEDIVAGALASLDHSNDPRLAVSVPETVPPVRADGALLERAVANVVANALVWAPPDQPVRVEAGEVADRVHLRIIDTGPGIRPADRERVFTPFQHLGDQSNRAGAGLGLAVARGFVQAIGGTLSLDDTPGGGLTVVIDLERAPG